MHLERTCENCSAPFQPRRSDARCCSKRCAKQRLYRVEVEKTCAFCSKVFRTRWKQGRYCSHLCGLRARFADHAIPSTECLQCGKTFGWTSHRSEPRKFCSRKCHNTAQRKYDSPRCARCSKPVTVHEPRVRGKCASLRRYCSMACRVAYAAEKAARKCDKCGRQFRTRIYKAGQTRLHWFCSKTCRYPESHRRKVGTAKQIMRSHRKRANGGQLTQTEWEAIKALYGFRCAYCGIKPKRYLSMDHIIPVSAGGRHDADNVVPACRSCNSRKGNRPAPTFQPFLLTA